VTHSDTCRKIVYYINQRHEEILKIYKKDKVPRGPGGPVPRQTAHQPRARRIVASSSQAFGACAPVRHVISRTLPGRQESQGAGQSSIETTSKRHRSVKQPKPLAAHLMLKLYTLYTSLHFSAYLQVLAGLYSVDWTWWCDDVWCFICKFAAIAVNSCASACIAIMAMLEESTS